jgi:GMP synthase-like glutamine amidotransferase
MHIAVLVTNTDRSEFAGRHPGDGAKFAAMIAGVRPGWQVTAFDLTAGEYPQELDRMDGVIIGGSPASVNGHEPWSARLDPLIRDIVGRGQKLFGACFGHQAIARALGGRVADNPRGWVLGVTETRIDRATPWTLAGRIRMNAAHSEQVMALPPGAEVLGGNADCPVGFYRIGRTVFATQYHPEMTDDFMAALVAEFAPMMAAGVAASARGSLAAPADTARFSEAIARFFEG